MGKFANISVGNFTIETVWQRAGRVWRTRLIDPAGNQIGAASFDGTEAGARVSRELADMRNMIAPGYYATAGVEPVLFYHGPDFDESDWRVVMRDVCERLDWRWTQAQELAYAAYTADVVDRYRRSQPAVPSAGMRAEARAAHGAGVKLVDVFTGRTFTT
jgi:hypothetical protein